LRVIQGLINLKDAGGLPKTTHNLSTTTSQSRKKRNFRHYSIKEFLRTRLFDELWQKETVYRWSKRYRETSTMETRKHTGRPAKRRVDKEHPAPRKKRRKSERRKQMTESDHGKVEAGLSLG